jgi:hypothetical protein
VSAAAAAAADVDVAEPRMLQYTASHGCSTMAAVTDLASFCAAVGFDAEDLLHITDGELAELFEEYDVKGRAKIQVKKELRLAKAAATGGVAAPAPEPAPAPAPTPPAADMTQGPTESESESEEPTDSTTASPSPRWRRTTRSLQRVDCRRRRRLSLVGGPKVIFEISSIGPRIPFSRPKMCPENAWWRHFCEETAPCGRKSAFLPTACVREYITLFFSMFM